MIVVVGLCALAVGLVAGLALAALRSRRRPGYLPVAAAPTPAPHPADGVVDVLRAGALVLDSRDEVVLLNPAARRMNVVRGGRVAAEDLLRIARDARRTQQPRETEIELHSGRLGVEPTAARVRVAPLGDEGHVVLLVEDLTESRRVEAVRRDFVANVSHELKTPVGALSLLSEALLDAHDDPEAVRRFASRVLHEASRLARLVQEIIDLSRLQGADPLPPGNIVALKQVVAEALDRSRLGADARAISIVHGGDLGLYVLGSEAQLVTALSNLLDNAVAYSPEHTRVAVGVKARDGWAEVSVTDQGIGIAETDLGRVFERFYRADPARSRDTGGTGLGLAIVKHVASNHGGSVSVWSVEGSGSTFTLRLPVAPAPAYDDSDGRLSDDRHRVPAYRPTPTKQEA